MALSQAINIRNQTQKWQKEGQKASNFDISTSYNTSSTSLREDYKKEIAFNNAKNNAKIDNSKNQDDNPKQQSLNKHENKFKKTDSELDYECDGKIFKLNANIASYDNNVYINGINTHFRRAVSQAIRLFREVPENNYILYNSTSGFITDAKNSILGKFSDKQGQKLEKSVNSLALFIKEKILEKDEHVTIHCYSQGTIITKNALSQLKGQLPQNEFRKICKNLTLNLYGAATFKFPDEIQNINSYENPFDPVTTFIGHIGKDSMNNKIKGDAFGSHNMNEYVLLKNKKETENNEKGQDGFISKMIKTTQNVSNEIYEGIKHIYKKTLKSCKKLVNNVSSWITDKIL